MIQEGTFLSAEVDTLMTDGMSALTKGRREYLETTKAQAAEWRGGGMRDEG